MSICRTLPELFDRAHLVDRHGGSTHSRGIPAATRHLVVAALLRDRLHAGSDNLMGGPPVNDSVKGVMDDGVQEARCGSAHRSGAGSRARALDVTVGEDRCSHACSLTDGWAGGTRAVGRGERVGTATCSRTPHRGHT